MQRARKIERFLSQPFFVAEEFTGTPGAYVPIAETIRGFEEIIDGKHDEVPESALLPEGHDRRGRRGGRKSSEPTPHQFPVEVLTPEGEVFSEEIEMLSTRTAVGSIGVLANHEPLLAMLEPTELRLYRSETDIVRFAQAEGYMQFADNRALVLVEEAIAPERARPRDAARRGSPNRARRAERAEEDSEEHARAQRDIRRYEAFLAVASSGP